MGDTLDHQALGQAWYIGGHPKLDQERQGILWVDHQGIGISTGKTWVARVPLTEIASVDISGGQVAVSKVPAVLLFGVLGGLAAKGSMDQSTLGVKCRDGETAWYVVNVSPSWLRAKITPFLRRAGVPFQDEASVPAASDLGNQLRDLAALRDEGLLTENEFAVQKAKLLGT